ncbi:NlpC/P60 family putative phage cell wall peptidase [Devosia subaequoris]|uniref:NlpC/P60 family putative phage cell wall peptidase n=1 Tax=Devosia subaequoris TaxID=395930 RepID=A0A7W6NAU9_9HYPH|nr:NlpC/P60 family protein [Devosia subaequoris]MBB4051044.1 NlpC/P60 family putative phage cell wall peptidase [Devosia subaequoris]MCP1208288.1 NlpC/P60 family protein [Devosia subaequoris]
MNAELVVRAAQAWLGTPYRHQASALGAGCDCLGLLRGVWRTLYGDEPVLVPPYRMDRRGQERDPALRLAAERFLIAVEGPAQAGQAVLFRLGGTAEPRHCGILIAPGRFIHAQEHLGVIEANLTSGWAKRVSGRYRFPAQS